MNNVLASLIREAVASDYEASSSEKLVLFMDKFESPSERVFVSVEQQAAKAKAVDFDAEPVGESHFMADRPMTVRAGTSAMVAMVHGETTGGVVYLYDPISDRGDERARSARAHVERRHAGRTRRRSRG